MLFSPVDEIPAKLSGLHYSSVVSGAETLICMVTICQPAVSFQTLKIATALDWRGWFNQQLLHSKTSSRLTSVCVCVCVCVCVLSLIHI